MFLEGAGKYGSGGAAHPASHEMDERIIVDHSPRSCSYGCSCVQPGHKYCCCLGIYICCMTKKLWPLLFTNLLYKMDQDFLDRQYHVSKNRSK